MHPLKQSSGLVPVPGSQLDAVLGLCWLDTLEAARAGFEGVPLEDLPPLDQQQTELAMEALKILFNITFDKGRRSVDEVRKALPPHYRTTLMWQRRHFDQDYYIFILPKVKTPRILVFGLLDL